MRSKGALGWLLAATIGFHAAVAHATGEQETKARALFEVGGRAYDNGEFDVALQAFEQAYALYPKESLLFSMAQAHRRLFAETKDARSRDEALRLFREYLDKVKSGKRRAEANALLGELEATVPSSASPQDSKRRSRTRLFVASSTPGMKVTIDGGTPVPANRTIEIAPGKHSLLLQSDGFVEQKLDIDAAADEVLPLSRDLLEKPAKLQLATTSGASLSIDGRFVGEAPLSAPLDVAAGEHFVALELAGHETRSELVTFARGAPRKLDLSLSPTAQRYLSYAFIGAGSATAVASGVFVAMAFVQQGEANDLLEKQQASGLEDGDLEAYDDARAGRDRFVLGAGISGGAAGALLITGLALYLADPADRAAPPARKEQPGPKPDAPSGFDVAFVPLLGPGMVAGSARLRY